MMSKRTVSAITLALRMLVSAPLYGGNPGTPPRSPNQAASTYTAPTADEAADMLFMREEEKLARDVYLTLFDAWGLTPFANIAVSEQSHMNAMLLLLRKYRLPDPAAGNSIGEFTDPDLQTLYDTLIARGLGSAVEGLKVGALIEEVDMRDILAAIGRSTKTDITAVYENLICGSRNHLRAFVNSIEALTGVPYAAQLLDQAAVDAIVAAPMERCGRR
jgi:hypothetical protein